MITLKLIAAWLLVSAILATRIVMTDRVGQVLRIRSDLVDVVAGRRALGDVRWGRS